MNQLWWECCHGHQHDRLENQRLIHSCSVSSKVNLYWLWCIINITLKICKSILQGVWPRQRLRYTTTLWWANWVGEHYLPIIWDYFVSFYHFAVILKLKDKKHGEYRKRVYSTRIKLERLWCTSKKTTHKKRTPIGISIFSCGCQTQEISLTDIINLLSKAVYF